MMTVPTETWVLPRPRKVRYKGGFPLHFEKKLWRLLGEPVSVLHPFGGKAEIGVRVDERNGDILVPPFSYSAILHLQAT